MTKQRGFTLIELAIVLVIIGLLLGGVLKGRELINSAKAKNMANDFTSISAMVYAYQDKFKSIPGDDAAATNHAGSAATNGDGDGVIEGKWDTATSADESCVIWQHARLAGLIPGITTVSCAAGNTYQPKNAEGGSIGVQSISTGNTFTTIPLMTGVFVICSDHIPGSLAKQLDTALDDGVTNTGAMRAIDSGTTGAAIATASIADGSIYTVCMTY